jgi:hypothetical protein
MSYYAPSIPSERILFGARVAYQNASYGLWIQNGYYQTDFGNEASQMTVNPIGRVTVDKNKNITSLNTSTTIYTNTATTFAPGYSMYLFTLN